MEEGNNFEKILEESNGNLLKDVTADKIMLSRLSAYGSAGTALAIILVLLQIDVLDIPLSVSIYSAIFVLPAFVVIAIGSEAFLYFGEKTFSYFRQIHQTRKYVLLNTAAYGGLVLSFLGIVAHFSYLALIILIGIS